MGLQFKGNFMRRLDVNNIYIYLKEQQFLVGKCRLESKLRLLFMIE